MSFDNEYHLNSKTRTTFYRNFTNFIVIKVTSDSMPSIERWNFFIPGVTASRLVQRESFPLSMRTELVRRRHLLLGFMEDAGSKYDSGLTNLQNMDKNFGNGGVFATWSRLVAAKEDLTCWSHGASLSDVSR